MKISAADKVRTRKPIKAEDEFIDEEVVVDEVVEDEVADVEVEDDAMGLLFEAEDVAELVAEITETPVEVTVDDDSVVFAIGDDEYTVTPEGDEEILEAVRRPFRNKKSVKASAVRKPLRRDARPARRVSATRKPTTAGCKPERKPEKKTVKASRTIKKFPTKK